eukprot:1391047-Pyramimonas_sp.AAC.1
MPILDYWMVSGFFTTVLQQPTRVGGFPAMQHFPMAVPLGPHPRGQQLCRLQGPAVFPPKPTTTLVAQVDADDEPCYSQRGGSSVGWINLMRSDSGKGHGDVTTRDQRLQDLAAALYNGVERELAPLFHTEQPDAAFCDRADGPHYAYTTAGGALSRQQPAGTQMTRALRILQAH